MAFQLSISIPSIVEPKNWHFNRRHFARSHRVIRPRDQQFVSDPRELRDRARDVGSPDGFYRSDLAVSGYRSQLNRVGLVLCFFHPGDDIRLSVDKSDADAAEGAFGGNDDGF